MSAPPACTLTATQKFNKKSRTKILWKTMNFPEEIKYQKNLDLPPIYIFYRTRMSAPALWPLLIQIFLQMEILILRKREQNLIGKLFSMSLRGMHLPDNCGFQCVHSFAFKFLRTIPIFAIFNYKISVSINLDFTRMHFSSFWDSCCSFLNFSELYVGMYVFGKVSVSYYPLLFGFRKYFRNLIASY